MSARRVWYTTDSSVDRLSCETITEAVQEFVDATEPDSPLPATVTVFKFVQRKLTFEAAYLLDLVLETIDENFGDPDEGTDPSPAMLEAAEVFRDVIVREYDVWRCDRVADFQAPIRFTDAGDLVDVDDLVDDDVHRTGNLDGEGGSA